MSKLLDLITPPWLHIGGIAALALIVWLAYHHYVGLVDDLNSAQTAVATLTQQLDAEIDLANANAEATKRAHEEAVAVAQRLEAAQAENEDITAKMLAARAAAQRVPAMPVSRLERMREQLFGDRDEK